MEKGTKFKLEKKPDNEYDKERTVYILQSDKVWKIITKNQISSMIFC